ncbi:NAD(+) synthase [Xylanibacter muris]|uniref:Glutamine-dependent NAD(+) synthetase n=1 Tax=Xylanibacter muris TaxID=2736290 RepID=A0ABX2ARK0_9BACT|nr:NAD(+) synthase [Xylanibacter muris]NPD92662.1 NAD(+) synthase [Xylanibacter muris]
MNHGFITVAAAIPSLHVADTRYNVNEIGRMMSEAESEGVEIICFPELSVTSYTCQDLFDNHHLLESAGKDLAHLLCQTSTLDIIAIIGIPVHEGAMLYNSAIVVQHGKIAGVVVKTYLPNYDEFYEKRWFDSSLQILPSREQLGEHTITIAGQEIRLTSEPQVFRTASGVKFGVEICEDVWATEPPSNNLALAGADIIFNLSATNELVGKHRYLMSLLSEHSARIISGYVYSSAGFGESSQDVVYGGNAIVIENGTTIAKSKRFSIEPQLVTAQIDVEKIRAERRRNSTFTTVTANKRANARIVKMDAIKDRAFKLTRKINPLPFIPEEKNMRESCEETINIQTFGLMRRLTHTHCKSAVIGISGGLDSTLALLICVKAFDNLKLDRKGIIGITMPGFGTTGRTHDNAVSLMTSLGITQREIGISESVTQHFKDIGHNPENHDVTYENSQARERTQILMDVANQTGGLVVGTGDLSELALGWATYNGDHMSMYAVNSGVPKTLIKYIVDFFAKNLVDEKSSATLLDIIDTPISPELIPADENGDIKQKTEDLVGPYELHDFFLYNFLRFGFCPEKILFMALRAFDGSNDKAGKYDEKTIRHWLSTFFRRFFSQQFKRSCMPDGPKVGSVSLSPRGDWRMPSDATGTLWNI